MTSRHCIFVTALLLLFPFSQTLPAQKWRPLSVCEVLAVPRSFAGKKISIAGLVSKIGGDIVMRDEKCGTLPIEPVLPEPLLEESFTRFVRLTSAGTVVSASLFGELSGSRAKATANSLRFVVRAVMSARTFADCLRDGGYLGNVRGWDYWKDCPPPDGYGSVDGDPVWPVGAGIQLPRLIKHVSLTRPAGYGASDLVVVVSIVIDTQGRVREANILRVEGGPPDVLGQEAIETVRQWQFEPPELGKKAVPLRATISLTF